MNQVHTEIGLIDRDQLEVEDIIQEDSNSRSIATEWRLDGKLVKRDVHVIVLNGLSLFGDQQEV